MNRTLGKYVYLSFFVQIVNVVINFIYSLVIVRLLGAAGYGEYSVFNNSLAFAVLLLGFNLPSAITFFVVNKRIDAAKLLYSFLAVSLLMSFLLASLLINSNPAGLSEHVFPGGINKPLWVFFFCANFFLLQTNQLLTAFLNAHKVFIPGAVFSMSCNLLLLVLLICLALNLVNISLPLFDLLWWAAIVINSLVALYSVFLVSSFPAAGRRPGLMSILEIRLITRFTLVVYVCNTLQFLNYKMDIWFVNYFKKSADVGVYALCLALSQLIWVLPNAISSVLLNYYKVGRRKNSVALAMQYASVTFYGSILTAVLLSVIYYFALPYVYGDDFSTAFELCLFLFAGTIPFSLSIIIANLNSGIGFVRINLYATIFTFAGGLALDVILIPVYGIAGAAAAKVIMYVAGLIFHIVVCSSLYKLPWIQIFKWPRLKAFLALTSVNKY